MRSFLQTPEWQKIQEASGRAVFLVPGEGGYPVLVIKHDLPYGRHYLYCPHPDAAGASLYNGARAIAAAEGSLFLKIDPLVPPLVPKARPGRSLQPRKTSVVPLQQEDGALLAHMRQKTRYNIRLALRHGVSARPVSLLGEPERADEFFEILAETAARDNFFLHPREHYRQLLETSSKDFSNELWIAQKDGRTIAGAIVNRYLPSGAGTYLHGASRTSDRSSMASYALHWEIMRSLRDRGADRYDWGGVDERRWPGLTRFKLGFGGRIEERPRSVDVAFRPLGYFCYRSLGVIRRLQPWRPSFER